MFLIPLSLFLFLGVIQGSENNKITGVWVLTKYVTQEYTRTGFDEDVIVMYCPNGRHLANPLNTPLAEQTNAYTLENDILAFYEYDPETSKRTQEPYTRYKILALSESEFVIKVVEVDGHPPKPYQVIEQSYKRLAVTDEYGKIFDQCK